MADVLASSPISKPALLEGDENAECTPPVRLNSTTFKDINESKAELLARVQSLRKDLREWRGKLDNQVHVYRQELGELRNTLNVEVEQLKTEFQDLRLSLKKQLDDTAKLSDMIPSKLSSPSPMKKEQNMEEEVHLPPPKPLNKEDALLSTFDSEHVSP